VNRFFSSLTHVFWREEKEDKKKNMIGLASYIISLKEKAKKQRQTLCFVR